MLHYLMLICAPHNRMWKSALSLGIPFLLLSLAFMGDDSNAQENGKPEYWCGSAEYHQKLMEIDSLYRFRYLEIQEYKQEYIQKQKTLGSDEKRTWEITIPVVVHVVYNLAEDPEEYITVDKINSHIDLLNENFGDITLNNCKLNYPGFAERMGNPQIKFVLAQRDEHCEDADGYTHTPTTKPGFFFDVPDCEVKHSDQGGIDAWPTDKYLNIWVCDVLRGVAFGTNPAVFENEETRDLDGIVIDYTRFGNPPIMEGEKHTLTHEIGHWLDLCHIWSCSDPGCGCDNDDRIDDTPKQDCSNWGECPDYPHKGNLCSGEDDTFGDMFMNFMDYTWCDLRCMFTDDQILAMEAALYGPRASILASNGWIPPPPGIEQPDLWSQDNPDDDGTDNYDTDDVVYLSDDIWIRHVDDDVATHEDPEYNRTNRVYVRVRNRGCGNADSKDVKLYWAKASTGLGWPTPWLTEGDDPDMGGLIDIEPTGSVDASDFTIVEFDWFPPDPDQYEGIGKKSHFCLLACIQDDDGNLIVPRENDLYNSVKESNNIVWKNVEVVKVDGRYAASDFIIRNTYDSPAMIDLRFRVEDWVLSMAGVYVDYSQLGLAGPPDLTDFFPSGAVDEAYMIGPVAWMKNIPMGPNEYGVINVEFWRLSEILIKSGADDYFEFRVDVTQYSNGSETPDGGIAYDVTMLPMGNKITIEKIEDVYQGHYTDVLIWIENSDREMGGFDFLIAYDASALNFMEATPGQLLEDCGWEYFTYAHGAVGSCGSACPSGMLRVVAIADMNDGPNHPSCYGSPDFDPHELANMRFLVTNDRTYECQYVPIQFFWGDCGDNTISSTDGETLYIDRTIYDFEGDLIWDEEDDDQFPEDARIPFVGAPDYCLNPDPDKPTAIRFIDFVNGGIDIICSDSIDTRGDINLNGAAYEIADAVVFTNYFVYGLDAFTVNQEGQIAATDVNADGMVLSVADLTYLIRVIIGDALPYPKIAPVTAKYDIKDGVLSVDQEMGAVYVVIRGNANPVNLTDNMEMKYAYDSENDVTRALLYSMEKGHKYKGEFLEPGGTLIEIEMATYEGATVKLITDLLPTEFVLHQNKPNPFNPITDMSFSLPVASDVVLEIYNVTGQKVATVVEDRFEAGTHTVRWDGSNYASGIYMYRITAGGFTDSKKMLLLK